MNHPHFQKQMGRLSERWKGVYVPSLVEIVWREVKQFPDSWFTRCVDDLIGNCRQAPLMPDFRERISLERERSWITEKSQHADDAKHFFGVIESGEHSIVLQYIVKRMLRQVSDEDWAAFMNGLKGVGA